MYPAMLVVYTSTENVWLLAMEREQTSALLSVVRVKDFNGFIQLIGMEMDFNRSIFKIRHGFAMNLITKR